MVNTRKVILVEDNPADVELVRISVENLPDVELIHVGDGQELLSFLNTEYLGDIAVIMLDLNMPRVSGFDVLQFIKNGTLEQKRIPVVMFTTSNSRTDIMKCYELGARAFVSKPLDIYEFNSSVQAIVEFWLKVNILPTI